MNRWSYVILGIFLFTLLNLPQEWVNGGREGIVSLLSPIWLKVSEKKEPLKDEKYFSDGALCQIMSMQDWLIEEKRLEADRDALESALEKTSFEKLKKSFQHEKQILSLRYSSCPASVIFRDPSSWSSSCWIALGEKDNQALGRAVIARNSPVLAEHGMVGVVEYVGETESRVRLITDAGINLAVRAVRGGSQNREMGQLVQNLLTRISSRNDLFSSSEERERLIGILDAFGKRLQGSSDEKLAKGELCGCSEPLWRSRGPLLKGLGFNYDFPDEEGPERDLRSHPSLILSGDLLVTSGLDGVFPANLPVAVVTKIFPLKEGDYTYEIEAKPVAGDLMDLHTVFVLPPLSGCEEF